MWVGGGVGVHGGVWWRKGWQKEHVLSWGRVLMIGSLYPVCLRSRDE